MGLFGGLGSRIHASAIAPPLPARPAAPMPPAPAVRPPPRRRPGRVTTLGEAARAWQRLDADGRAAFERWLTDYTAGPAAPDAAGESAAR